MWLLSIKINRLCSLRVPYKWLACTTLDFVLVGILPRQLVSKVTSRDAKTETAIRTYSIAVTMEEVSRSKFPVYFQKSTPKTLVC